MMLGRLHSFWEGLFSGAMLNLFKFPRCNIFTWCSCRNHWSSWSFSKDMSPCHSLRAGGCHAGQCHWRWNSYRTRFIVYFFLCRITVDGRNPAQLGCQNPCNLWDIYHIIWCRISSINRVNVKCCIANGPCQVRVTLVESNVSPMLVLNLSTWTSDWCFKYCVFSSLPEEMIQFDSYFSDGLNTTN